jgi:hypothetical protein
MYNVPPMRVLIKYSTYDGVTVHCLAKDARTLIGPFRKLEDEGTLYTLLAYVGGDAEKARTEIKRWGHGGIWANVPTNRLYLLGIKLRLIFRR